MPHGFVLKREIMKAIDTTNNPTFPKTTRAGFVRALPITMPVADVIERGREQGLEIKESDVHATRYYMREEMKQTKRASEEPLQWKPGISVLEHSMRDAIRMPQPLSLVQPPNNASRTNLQELYSQLADMEFGEPKFRAGLEDLICRVGTVYVRELIDSIERRTDW